MMIYTVLGIFDDTAKAQNFLIEAEAAGFSLKRISCILHYPKTVSQKYAMDNTLTMLLHLYKVTIPDNGTLLIGGPLTASFGLTGATRATINDAATGLVAGGITGGLVGLGISKSFAIFSEKNIRNGKILLGLPATDEQIPFIQKLFTDHDVIHSVVIKTPTHQYPYLLSSLIFAQEQPVEESFPAYIGMKGGGKSKSQATKKPKDT